MLALVCLLRRRLGLPPIPIPPAFHDGGEQVDESQLETTLTGLVDLEAGLVYVTVFDFLATGLPDDEWCAGSHCAVAVSSELV